MKGRRRKKEKRRIKMETYLSTLHIFRKYWTGLAFGKALLGFDTSLSLLRQFYSMIGRHEISYLPGCMKSYVRGMRDYRLEV